jgi:hypothetical protein
MDSRARMRTTGKFNFYNRFVVNRSAASSTKFQNCTVIYCCYRTRKFKAFILNPFNQLTLIGLENFEASRDPALWFLQFPDKIIFRAPVPHSGQRCRGRPRTEEGHLSLLIRSRFPLKQQRGFKSSSESGRACRPTTIEGHNIIRNRGKDAKGMEEIHLLLACFNALMPHAALCVIQGRVWDWKRTEPD